MKTTIIELLNKIANGEEVPEHIKIRENEWYFYKSRNTYGDKKSAWIVWDWYVEENRLNDEVEIIEEDKKIEKLESYISCGWNGTCKDLKKEDLFNNLKKIGNKINEIIDRLNEGDKE